MINYSEVKPINIMFQKGASFDKVVGKSKVVKLPQPHFKRPSDRWCEIERASENETYKETSSSSGTL